jgi:hypothetical protein
MYWNFNGNLYESFSGSILTPIYGNGNSSFWMEIPVGANIQTNIQTDIQTENTQL